MKPREALINYILGKVKQGVAILGSRQELQRASRESSLLHLSSIVQTTAHAHTTSLWSWQHWTILNLVPRDSSDIFKCYKSQVSSEGRGEERSFHESPLWIIKLIFFQPNISSIASAMEQTNPTLLKARTPPSEACPPRERG